MMAVLGKSLTRIPHGPSLMRAIVLVSFLVVTVLVFAGAPVAAGQTEWVSVSSAGLGGDDWSREPVITPDGRYVAFLSQATNLVADDSGVYSDIFVHDRVTGETERVSVASDGAEGNRDCDYSSDPTISEDGRYVAFGSEANNLVPSDTNESCDIFVHDRQTGETARVSVATDGTEANSLSEYPSISADGRYVAFESAASNLVVGDMNETFDVFVRDRETGVTERVSVSGAGYEGDDESDTPCISADGRFVVFRSRATNLVSGDMNSAEDVFIHDRQTGATERVSLRSDGGEANGGSEEPCISADGRFVAFASWATNIVDGDTNAWCDVFVRDRQTGETERVSVSTEGAEGNDWSRHCCISPDGQRVAFYSSAALVAGDTEHQGDVYVHDRLTGVTERISAATDGTGGNGSSSDPAVSAQGRYVAFFSTATNLASGPDGEYFQILVRERPVADFEASATSGPAPLTVSFTELSTGAPTSWLWEFGDGGTATVQHPSHEYLTPGNYTVTLTVHDASCWDATTKEDYIAVSEPLPPAPTADFSASPTSGIAPLAVDFTDLSTGDPTSWSWEFGDGEISAGQNPNHTYDAAGIYTVSLTATNAGGSDAET
ncbi:MAG: PKD domain-containing protein, partial [Armatimonadetes bacterium]|nr:PKD domain-containing protein [Armatimonadota bacterium]